MSPQGTSDHRRNLNAYPHLHAHAQHQPHYCHQWSSSSCSRAHFQTGRNNSRFISQWVAVWQNNCCSQPPSGIRWSTVPSKVPVPPTVYRSTVPSAPPSTVPSTIPSMIPSTVPPTVLSTVTGIAQGTVLSAGGRDVDSISGRLGWPLYL